MVKIIENILQSFNSVSEYNIDSNTFEAQLYLLLNDKKDTTSRNKKRDAIAAPSDWGGVAPTNWGFPFPPPPPPPPGSWSNPVPTQTGSALPTPTISSYNTSSTTLGYYKSHTWHRTRHRTKHYHHPSTFESTPTTAPLNDDGSNSGTSNRNIGAIIGGVVGGVCGAAALIAILFILYKRSKNKKKFQNSGSISSIDMYSYRPDYNNTPRTFVQPANPHYDFDYIYCSPQEVGKDDRYVSPTENHSHRSWGDSSTVSNTAVYLPNEFVHHSELVSPFDHVKPNAK